MMNSPSSAWELTQLSQASDKLPSMTQDLSWLPISNEIFVVLRLVSVFPDAPTFLGLETTKHEAAR